MRAVPPMQLPLWQGAAHDPRNGGVSFDFNTHSLQAAGVPAHVLSFAAGLHTTTLSLVLRSGPFGSGPSFLGWRSFADAARRVNFPFPVAADAVDSGHIKTLTRGSHTWLLNTFSSQWRLPAPRSQAACKAAATAIPRRSTARLCAPLAALPLALLLQRQRAVPKPKARSSVLSLAAARASFRAPTTAIDLTSGASARRRSICETRLPRSFRPRGGRAFFICGAGSGPTLPERGESRCSRKS